MKSRSQAIMVDCVNRQVTRLYITPSRRDEILKTMIESEFLAWRKVKIGNSAYEMLHTSHHDADSHAFGFRNMTSLDRFNGNVLLFPSRMPDGTVKRYLTEDWEADIVGIYKNIQFLRKEYEWYPCESHEGKDCFAWVKAHSMKQYEALR